MKIKQVFNVSFLRKLFIPGRHNGHRPHAFRHAMLSVYSLVLIASQASFGVAFVSPAAPNPNQLSKEILTKINAERAGSGEPILAENPALDKAAQAKLHDMFGKNYWDHTSPSGEKAWTFIGNAGYSYSAAGENLARGFTSSDAMVNAWMASPSHKKNILDKDFKDTGIAVGNGKINGQEVTLAVQLFGDPAPVAAANPALVAGEKSVSPNFSLENPMLPGKVPYFMLYAIIFGLLVFDGAMIRMNKEHKNKKYMLAFRASLGINMLILTMLCLNISQIF